MANPTTNFGWQMPTASDLVTDLPADFEVFGQAVDTALVDLKGGTTGQVLSKASNTNMDFTWVTTDDANAIQNSIVDAKGDLIAASANDTPARLAVGNNGETLVADSSTSTGLKWAVKTPFIGCVLYNSGAGTQTIANNTVTSLTFNEEFIDTNGFHSTTVNTSRITIPTGLTGKYRVTACAVYDANAVGFRNATLWVNGVNLYQFGTITGSLNYDNVASSTVIQLSAGDYIEMRALQNSGGNLAVYLRDIERPFGVEFLGA